MKSFNTHTSEGTFTSGMIKSHGFMLRNKLSQNIKSGKASKDLSQKLDGLLDAQGIIGSIVIMNIGMEDGEQSLMSRSIIIVDSSMNSTMKELSHNQKKGLLNN